ncbi:MAG: glycosyltransferase family 2 protein [Alphaproteobacteria bacterium]|jgi:glycosyltransferase involved in cell wall biosynthesis|nr:glycosyltransferase family 2 protein [Alphaproteobacteria bacterium]MBT5390199.1 glycosyltransferase family 2 protein [Alphaproteobacteria bacterium]MBT5540431.1 glycosyltransferase family 2 protein [Alphaproteobacteria bacterium]
MTQKSLQKTTLSALVVAHNEEMHLDACLDQLKFADQIVVVLDKCTDGSEKIAKKYTQNIVKGSWDIEGERRNKGLSACPTDWILEVDADERISSALANEIRETINTTGFDYHGVPVDNYIGDHLVRKGWGAYFGKSQGFCLFKANSKVWGNQRVHPKITFTGTKGNPLQSPIVHHVDEDISDLLNRLNRYTSARALDIRELGIQESFGANIRRLFSRFYKCYVARKGYREGKYGFLIALCAGLYPLLSYLKATLEEKS